MVQNLPLYCRRGGKLMSELNRKLRVLFVDDEPAIRTNYTLALQNMFDTVYQASDGEEAYHIYEQYHPNILIVDINLPKLNGLALLQKISQEQSGCAMVVMSAHTDIDSRLQEYNLEDINYLVKPISRKIFINTLKKITQQYIKKRTLLQEQK